MAERPLWGVVYIYASTALSYALALVYVAVLTRFVPLAQYGYFNTLMALSGTISIAIPMAGINSAIAREGAAEARRGGDMSPYLGALIINSLALSALQAAVFIAMSQDLAKQAGLQGLSYLIAAYMLATGAVSALTLGLWMAGKVETMGKASLIGTLTFRTAQIPLIALWKNVYAIAVAMLIGQASALAYLNAKVRIRPKTSLGLSILKRRAVLNFGIQSWLIGGLLTLSLSATTYAVFTIGGPEAAGLFGIVTYMFTALTALGGAANSVFSSKAAGEIGLGRDSASLAQDYAIAAATAAAALATGAAAVTPLLPLLGIVHGEYVDAIPYAAVALGASALMPVATIYANYHWLRGKGPRAIAAVALMPAVNIATTILMYRQLGLYAAATALYMGYTATLIALKPSRKAAKYAALFTAFPAVAGALYAAAPPHWPAAQIAILTMLAATAYAAKPLPSSILPQLPKPLRPIAALFTA